MRLRLGFGLILAGALGLAPALSAEPALIETLRQTLRADEDWFGGFSGLEMSDDGHRLIAVTDMGQLVSAEIVRGPSDLVRLTAATRVTLQTAEGVQLTGMTGDAEGLALGADGDLWISREHDHGVLAVESATGVSEELPAHPDFITFQPNSGLEAFAVSGDNILYGIPERSGALGRPFPIYRYQNGQWDIAARLPRTPPFLPVGADMDGPCMMYLLERGITPLGFRSRIKRLDLCAQPLRQTLLMESFPGQYDNLEAISLWRNTDGQIMLSLLSDDNFLRVQRTELVEFRLTE